MRGDPPTKVRPSRTAPSGRWALRATPLSTTATVMPRPVASGRARAAPSRISPAGVSVTYWVRPSSQGSPAAGRAVAAGVPAPRATARTGAARVARRRARRHEAPETTVLAASVPSEGPDRKSSVHATGTGVTSSGR